MRKGFRKKILIFSFFLAFCAVVIATGIIYTTSIIPTYHRLEERNLETFNKIHCGDSTCDIRDLVNSWEFESADYVLTKDNFFLRNSGDRSWKEFWLNYSDTSFIKNFREPTSWLSPAGEKYRFYSLTRSIKGLSVEVLVGWVEDATWLLAPTETSALVDQRLKEEANKIANYLDVENGQLILKEEVNSNVDSFEVVDTKTKKVIAGSNIPAYLPSDLTVPRKPFFIDTNNNLFLVKTSYDSNKNLEATTLEQVGNLLGFCGIIFLIFFLIFSISYMASLTILKKYFLFFFSNRKPVLLSEALKSGEGQATEFKRGIVDEDLLKTITAFANTNDGTIFTGVNDEGKIEGLELKTPKEKELFVHQIFNLIRGRIRPNFLVRLDFEELRGYIIAKIFVPRGEEPLHYLDGVIYVRDGDSDVKAQPELVKKILKEYSL